VGCEVRDDGGYEVIEKERILDYKLMVYLCSETDSERLDWSRTINMGLPPRMHSLSGGRRGLTASCAG
jgi:hypothetical protein